MQGSMLFTPGATRLADGSVVWRVWAPKSSEVSLVTYPASGRREDAMTSAVHGYFSHRRRSVEEGLRYAFRLADGREYPDPASRWQPEGVHRPSAVFFPDAFEWSDASWRGTAREDLVIYELHVGTFTPEGTLDAIIPRLDTLRSLGVTAIELMPVAQFAGARNWGYDAVYPYAVQQSYGGPRALQRLVDAAHRAGLAVLLDVVYNHLGPEGNYLGHFGPYFTDRYRTPWGEAVNFDGPDSDAVRQFVVENALMWVRDFHLDGLRLDAIHAIYDFSARHILAEIASAVKRETSRLDRTVHVIAESDLNDVRLVRPRDRGGHGLDAVWSDDLHHAVHSLKTGEREGYYEDFGEPAHLAKALEDVYVYDGCHSPFRRRRHGSRVGRMDRTRFVVCIQNHDQIGNRARGERLDVLMTPAARRQAAGLLLISPCIPLLFMGEEYGERNPFPFFSSFEDPAIVEAVRRGRREEFAALKFQWGVDVPDPQSPETFQLAKIAWSWPEGSHNAQLRQLYQDLLETRRRWPALRNRRQTSAKLVKKTNLLTIQRGGENGLLAVVNLASIPAPSATIDLTGRRLLLSTEDVCYGGSREMKAEGGGRKAEVQQLLPHELLLFASDGGQP